MLNEPRQQKGYISTICDHTIKIKGRFKCLIPVLVILSSCVTAQKSTPVPDPVFYNSVKTWFSAWEMIHKEVYHLEKTEPVDFVFFDEKYVYATSNITIPEGDPVKGPSLLNHSLAWKKALHNDTITLPDKKRVPVGLMVFASPLPGEESKSFFVMPLPAFWQASGVTSQELGTAHLITGVFLHEFSHSQQMRNFGKRISELENAHSFGIPFSDDIVQHLFDKDSAYTTLYENEVNLFYNAAAEQEIRAKHTLIQTGIHSMRNRHNRYFNATLEPLKEIDAFFLTMEGLGQFTMYAWMTHKKGAGLPESVALKGIRRGKKWWSQDEGLALFLLLAQFAEPKNWASQMFSDKTESVVSLIEQQLNKTQGSHHP
jgi:hypothetical protein